MEPSGAIKNCSVCVTNFEMGVNRLQSLLKVMNFVISFQSVFVQRRPFHEQTGKSCTHPVMKEWRRIATLSPGCDYSQK